MDRPDFAALYLRQIILAEVGPGGQRRLANAVAAVGAAERGLEYETAVRYAQRVGFARIDEGQISVDDLAPAAVVHNEACRAVLAGSRAALNAMREVVLGPEQDKQESRS